MEPELSRRLARIKDLISEDYYFYILKNYDKIDTFSDLPKDLQKEVLKIENKLKKQ